MGLIKELFTLQKLGSSLPGLFKSSTSGQQLSGGSSDPPTALKGLHKADQSGKSYTCLWGQAPLTAKGPSQPDVDKLVLPGEMVSVSLGTSCQY